MNPESPTPREELEARLTALLLGELSADEAAALREIIGRDAQLAALHDRLKQTIQLVRETATDPAELAVAQPAPVRLAEERRQKLLAQFKTVTPAEFAPKPPQRSLRRILFEVAALVAILGLLAGLFLPASSRFKARSISQSSMVINNLRNIDAAKAQWALENKKGPQDSPTLQEILPYLGRGTGGELPKGAVGETYIVGMVGESPRAELDANQARNLLGTRWALFQPNGPGRQQVMLTGDGRLARVGEREQIQKQLVELQGRKSKETPAQPLPGSETSLAVADTGPARPEIGRQEIIILPATSETVEVPNSGNAPDNKFVSRYSFYAQSITNNFKVPVENMNSSKIDNLAELTPGLQPKLYVSANDLGLGEQIAKEKFDNASAAAAHGNEKTADGFDMIFGNNLGTASGSAAAPAAAPSAPVALHDGPVVMFQNTAGGAFAGGGGGGMGGGGRGGNNRLVGELDAGKSGLAPVPGQQAGASSFKNFGDLALASEKQPSASSALGAELWRSPMGQNQTGNWGLADGSVRKGSTGTFHTYLPAAQTVEQNKLSNGPTPSYDPETHAIVAMSDDKTMGGVSNLVKDLDLLSGTQVIATSGRSSTNTVAFDDRPLPKLTPPPSEPQPEMLVSENAFSTFSLNVSDVSFKLAAASLERGLMPDAASIRSEEFINAFDYRDPAPAPGAPLGFAWERAHDPFAHNRDFLRFAVKTAAAGREPGRPLNLVLLLDNSGSMERADRVAIIHEALRVLAAQLQPADTISVVTFARTARLWVDGIPGTQAAQVLETVGGLTPEGGTDLGDALDLAYATARRHYLMNGVNRVVLLTDGAANLGSVDPAALKKSVEAQRKQGIALDCFGIGWEGYNDDLLEVLTRNGDGRYGFLNTPEEAASGFAAQLAGALHVAASDVKVQVEFNPARVTSYRQIGYAKHQLTKEQFRDNTVNAAQIGAAESGNALYTVEVNPQGTGPICTVHVRYRDPGTADYYEHAWDVPYTGDAVALEQTSPAMRLAATASEFAEWLAASPFAAEVSPDALLNDFHGVPEVYGADTRPAQLETMIREAKSLTGK
jgi:Mg-chelatase subunit ChlD